MSYKYCYAILDSDNVCHSVASYETPLSEVPAQYVEISDIDDSFLDKRWVNGAWEVVPVDAAVAARTWRDQELAMTDWIVPLTDHPQHAAYITYRAALRAWPSTSDFPDTKPTLGS